MVSTSGRPSASVAASSRFQAARAVDRGMRPPIDFESGYYLFS
ncbi:hypothetical protein L519_2394 [Bordetella bronchiseptica MBORD678]|nr:hypothetical protein L519_2394 [Bordetella bronchiseptica MBORD678]